MTHATREQGWGRVGLGLLLTGLLAGCHEEKPPLVEIGRAHV